MIMQMVDELLHGQRPEGYAACVEYVLRVMNIDMGKQLDFNTPTQVSLYCQFILHFSCLKSF